MSIIRKIRYLLFVVLLSANSTCTLAQKVKEQAYERKMRLLDSLSMYKVEQYDTLFHGIANYTSYGNTYENAYDGWITKRSSDEISILQTNGNEIRVNKKNIIEIKPSQINDLFIQKYTAKDVLSEMHEIGNFGKNYLLVLWLYKKGNLDYSRQLFNANEDVSDEELRDAFGIVYYDAMLSSYSLSRNYAKAIQFGKHLSRVAFKGYEYREEAIELTAQLRKFPGDFSTFRMPDSLGWEVRKQKLTRQEQITYLADRLRLVNCVQPGQPGDISYEMNQFSVGIDEQGRPDFNYWEPNARYGVVNPYTELRKMELNPKEVELLLPYLLNEQYIPTYTYFRDFRPSRYLHRLSRVINSLMFECTNKLFFTQDIFYTLSASQKREQVEKIKQWCEENAGLSKQELVIRNLSAAKNWDQFEVGLQVAAQKKYDALLPVIVKRFYDFKGGGWPTNRGAMAKAMYDLGDARYINDVKKWNSDTTDLWVNLWASLFLLKNNKNSYEPAMDRLEQVLKKCDGASYYPHAMELLLTIHDKRCIKLAEGILDKPQFQEESFFGDYYLNFVKRLLTLKSDRTFNFFKEKLDTVSQQTIAQFNKNQDNSRMIMQGENFVMAVDKLRSDHSDIPFGNDLKERLKYRKQLSAWFAAQYSLLKRGLPNALNLNIKHEDMPVSFVDAPGAFN